MSLVDLFVGAVGEFDTRAQQVKPDQWHAPTPCTEWDVRTLVNHVVNEACWVKPLLGGKTLEEVGDSFDGDLLGEEPVRAWEAARDDELTAVRALDSVERPVHVSWGQIPASEYLSQVLLDHLIHGWDLARAVGADEQLDPELVQFCLAQVEPMEEAIRGSGVYGEKVDAPAKAGRQTQLLAILGRKD